MSHKQDGCMTIDVCYVLSHGFAVRMAVQTDLLGAIKANGKSVAVIVPDRNDPVIVEYCSTRDIPIYEFQPKASFWNENYLFKRMYFLEDIEANPALYEKHVFACRYNRSKHPLRRLRPYYYGLIFRAIRRFPWIRERFINQEQKQLKDAAATHLIAKIAPKRLVSTYPVNLAEARLLFAANQAPDIETWVHLLSWDNISCKGRFPQLADRYIAWGAIMAAELCEYFGIDEADIALCGVPHFDSHVTHDHTENRKAHLTSMNLDAEKPYVLMAMSSPRFAPKEIDIAEWLAQQITHGHFGDEMQLVIRPHPQNVMGNMSDASWLPRLERLNQMPNVAVSYPLTETSGIPWSLRREDMAQLSALLSQATVVLNSGSTVSIDALMHDRPVIITAFDGDAQLEYWHSARRLVDYTHLKKMIAMGGVSVCYSYPELAEEITTYVQRPTYRQPERHATIAAECLSRDGGATDRVAQVISSFS